MPDEPKIKNADRPAKDVGLPKTGDAASGAGYLRDVTTKNHEAETREPAEADLDEVVDDQAAPEGNGKPR